MLPFQLWQQKSKCFIPRRSNNRNSRVPSSSPSRVASERASEREIERAIHFQFLCVSVIHLFHWDLVQSEAPNCIVARLFSLASFFKCCKLQLLEEWRTQLGPTAQRGLWAGKMTRFAQLQQQQQQQQEVTTTRSSDMEASIIPV